MAVTFPSAQARRDLAELTPAQLEALYSECEAFRERLGNLTGIRELASLGAGLDRALAVLYGRLAPLPELTEADQRALDGNR